MMWCSPPQSELTGLMAAGNLPPSEGLELAVVEAGRSLQCSVPVQVTLRPFSGTG